MNSLFRQPFEMYLGAFVVAVLSFFLFLGQADASPWLDTEDCLDGMSCDGDVKTSITKVINYLLTFLGILAVIMIIYAGILMIMAQGEEENVEKGKKIIIWAVVGIIVITLSYAIVNFVVGAGGG